MIYESSASSRCAAGPKIAAIGGGTGLSTMLRGLKKYTDRLTAIVTVADDGGGSGVLRREMGILPPGDVRRQYGGHFGASDAGGIGKPHCIRREYRV